MGSSQPSNVAYEGDILITELDFDNLEDLEEKLQDWLDVGEDETLYVTHDGGDRIEVRILSETEL